MEPTTPTTTNLFSGLTIDWGFDAADIFTNGMSLVGSVAPFVLLGIAIAFTPRLISVIRGAVGAKGSK